MQKERHHNLLNVLPIEYSTYKINYTLQVDRFIKFFDGSICIKGNLGKP